MATKRLVVDISAHGFGHLAQTSAVVNALGRMTPGIDIIIRTHHSPAVVSGFVTAPHRLEEPAPDIGMLMTGPSTVDGRATFAAYRTLHERFADVVGADARRLTDLRADFLLSNIGYISLAASDAADIPCAAMCSLNWHDILKGYVEAQAADDILSEMRRAYRKAQLFIQPTPSMPMEWHPNRVQIPPIARTVETLARPAGLPPTRTHGGPFTVLVSLGGITSDYDVHTLPVLQEVHWIVAGNHAGRLRDDMTPLSQVGGDLLPLFPHADAIITKSGYGTFVEAAATGLRVLYAARPDWPEAPFLEPWLEENATAAAIAQHDLYVGKIAAPVLSLLNRPQTPPVKADGAEIAAALVLDKLGR